MKDFFKTIGILAVLAFLMWWFVASAVFAVRHPWATSTERTIHTGDALMFRQIPYNEMRPRD